MVCVVEPTALFRREATLGRRCGDSTCMPYALARYCFDPSGGNAGHEARVDCGGTERGGMPRASAPSASYASVLTVSVGRRGATVGGLFGAAPGRALCLVNLLVQKVAVPEEREAMRGAQRCTHRHSLRPSGGQSSAIHRGQLRGNQVAIKGQK